MGLFHEMTIHCLDRGVRDSPQVREQSRKNISEYNQLGKRLGSNVERA